MPEKRRRSSYGDNQLAPSPEPDRPQRKGSTSSVDSRMVAAELEAQNKDELFGTVEDVRGFLSRKEGLPGYISRQHIFEEFSKILQTKEVEASKRADVLNLSSLLVLDLLQGSKKAKKAEVRGALDVLLPSTIQLLGTTEQSVQQSAVKVLQTCLDKKNSPQVEALLVDHLVDDGIMNRKDPISLETIKLTPGLFLPDYLEETDVGPIIEALYAQLDNRNREQYAFSALMRHREAMTEEEYNGYTDKIPKKSRNLFKVLSQSYENKDFHVAKRPPKDGVSFGMIPNTIVNRLLEKHNRNGRAEGSLLLKRELENSAEEKFGQLLPYIGSFIKFLGGLLGDNNPKVTLHVLECHDVLLAHVPQAMRQYIPPIVNNMLGISLDSKLQIKIEIFRLMRGIMMISSPGAVINVMAPQLEHKNGRMREDIINFIIFALLTFPSDAFDFDAMIKMFGPLFLDPKRRVRQACLEALSIMAQCMGPVRVKAIYDLVATMDTGTYDTAEDISNAIACRLARKVLPRITEDGYVEYGLQIPYTVYTRNVHTPRAGKRSTAKSPVPNPDSSADIDWVMRGTGSLSRGSAGSVTLGVGGLGVSGSMVSLRSTKSTEERSQSVGPSGQDTWNKHNKIPEIRKERPASQNDADMNRQNSDDNPSMDDDDDDESVNPAQNDLDDEEEMDQDDEDTEPRVLSPGEQQKRSEAYDTIPRSQSEMDLRQAAMTPPPGGQQKRKNSLLSVQEEEDGDDDVPPRPPSQQQQEQQPQQQGSDKSGKNKGFSARKMSIADLGLAISKYATQFDEVDNEDEGDDAPGAFKRPKSAFTLARSDLKSKEWQSEIEGLEAMVRLFKWHKEVVTPEIDGLLHDLSEEMKNLRSQVTRAAIQSLVKLFFYMGHEVETSKNLDSTIYLLLMKTSDTNRFIRMDASAALDACSEHLSVARAIALFSKAGLGHKHVAARSSSGRLIANIVEKVGSANLLDGYPDMKENRETTELVLKTASTLMADGSIDTRTEAKRIFAVIISHEKFDLALRTAIGNPAEVEKILKSISGLKSRK